VKAVTKESPEPATYKKCRRSGDETCVLRYDHTKRDTGTRVFYCTAHQFWVYEFPILVTYGYANNSTFRKVIR
jgi:hypothetical protein